MYGGDEESQVTGWADIVNEMWQRRQRDSYLLRQMIEARDRYNGDVIIPMPDVDGEPVLGSLAPQIVADGIDHNAMRAASVIPAIACPALGPKPSAKENASVRRRALYANWHWNGMELILYRYFRHYIGYGTASVVVVPDFEEERARIELRDPLTSYPELRAPEDFRSPLNVGFVFGRSEDWLFRAYPEARSKLKSVGQAMLWDMVEWIDEDDIVMGVLGPRNAYSLHDDRVYGSGASPSQNSMELRRWPNRAGIVPCAVPRRATLDRIMGQLTHVFPTIDLLDRMTALEAIQAERGTFPDMVIMGKRTAIPTLHGGRWKDGREGEPNIVLDADGVQLLNTNVSQSTMAVIQNLERTARTSGGVLTQFGGETSGAYRTGRALDTLAGFSVDPRVMEAQKFAARALETVNKAVMAVENGYWPDKKYTVYSGWSGDMELVKYSPERHFITCENAVTYALPGTDISQATVALTQLVGGGLMSRDTARVSHPMIADAALEEKAVVRERIEEAMLVAFLQQATTGALPLIDLVTIDETFQLTGSMIEAVKKADAEARARQAAETPPPPDGMAQAPEAQPGLAMPGQGAEGQLAPGPGLPPQQRMQQLLAALQAPPNQIQTRIG